MCGQKKNQKLKATLTRMCYGIVLEKTSVPATAQQRQPNTISDVD